MVTTVNTLEDISTIIVQNQERRKILFAKYDPYTGEGSPIPRCKLYLDDIKFVWLPDYIYNTQFINDIVKEGSLYLYADRQKLDYNAVCDFLNELRIKYDFEYWCATCAKIKDKTSGSIMPFVLRRPQLKLVQQLIADLFAGKPIRVIILKARQWGGSTVVQLFMAWIQIFHRTNWNSVIIAHQKDAARNIRAMYSLLAKHHPKDVFPMSFRNFEGSQSNRLLINRDCVMSIGSVVNPEALRSDDIKLVHGSEVGLWGNTVKRNADDMIQAVVSSVPEDPFTCVILESTAKGIGNYFHTTWCDAEERKNAYTPIFVSWFEISIYYRPFQDEDEMIQFIRSMTPDELYRFNIGATLEGLNWYRIKRRTITDDWRMKCEFPSTPQEAFATTGRSVHDSLYIEAMRVNCCAPKYIGELHADAAYGKLAIDSSLSFSRCDNGCLFLWAMPDRSKNILNRYIVSMDIGGKNEKADWTVLSVIDRYMMLFGGDEECVGTYRFHLDQDLSVWKAVQLAKFFNDALLVVEFNSLDTKTTEGDHTYTILDEIVGEYDNLYYRDDPTKIREGLPPHYGFHTNKATKRDLITHMNRRLRDQTYIEYDKRALDECEWYEQKINKDVFGAVEGKHDDIYMSRAIGLKVSFTIDLPQEAMQNKPLSFSKGVRSQSSI